ncbi:MAG: ABC transporter ATP-binding protein [Gammaproteobacteria bacterium]|nr:ABC transporter ATP-binding protein [Gammaproteobacteria bacterium]
MKQDKALLQVSGLNISYGTKANRVTAVHELSFELNENETLGLVGESGSGKTQTALSLLGLCPENAHISGQALFAEQNLLQLSEQKLNNIRGNKIAMIFQDPMTSLNPHLTIGKQMARVLQRHRGISRRDALLEASTMLEAVRIPEAPSRLDQYPHELSGGMRQRVMIATALLCKPRLLIADEPTTALDVTVQAQILELMKELQQEFGTAILLITHDMGVVAASCDRLLVLRDGEEQESGPVNEVFYQPRADYTQKLLAAVPRLDEVRQHRLAVVGGNENTATGIAAEPGDILLTVNDAQVYFRSEPAGLFQPAPVLRAVDGISFELRAGETLGVVGESGCGKSSLARGILRLVDLHAGRVMLMGDSLTELDAAALKAKRKQMQVIFQDPLASLNPRMTIGDIVAEPLQTFFPALSRAERTARVTSMLLKVGLQAEHVQRYPHEFSGGQCQRIGIARALITEPELIICDEPVSALDVSVQAQVINLLMDLQHDAGLALIFIAHDLAVVRHISHRVMVMYLGRVVEIADRESLYAAPRHPYTQALINAVPIPDPELESKRDRSLLQGDLPSPLNPPSGCTFRTRCPLADTRCAVERPELRVIANTQVACHHAV